MFDSSNLNLFNVPINANIPFIQNFKSSFFLVYTLTVPGIQVGQPEVDLQANWTQFSKS